MENKGEEKKRKSGPVVRFFRRILLLIAALLAVYGAAVLLYIGTGGFFNFVILIAAALVALFALLLGPLVRRAKLLLALILIFAGVFVYFAGSFIKMEIECAGSVPEADADWVIVLGAKVRYDGISREYAERLNAALEYARANPGCTVITTGGQGPDEPRAEGLAGYQFLEAHSIDTGRLIAETESESTKENLSFALDLIKKNGGSASDKVVIITSAFHIYRAGLIAKDTGFTDVSFKGSTGILFILPYYYFREFAAYVYANAAHLLHIKTAFAV